MIDTTSPPERDDVWTIRVGYRPDRGPIRIVLDWKYISRCLANRRANRLFRRQAPQIDTSREER